MNILKISAQELCSCVGKLIFQHDKVKNQSGAYEIFEKCKITVSVPRHIGASALDFTILSEDLGKTVYYVTKNEYTSTNQEDIFSLSIDLKKLGVGLFFTKLKLNTLIGDIYCTRVGESLHFAEEDTSASFQLSVSSFKYAAPEQKYGGVIYHIFVDRFRKTECYRPHKDAVFVSDWSAEIPEYPAYPGAFLKNNYFYGGTLDGISEKLDYIASLGVNMIYLSPIFKAYSNHKYDTGDYMTVDESFGGDAALSSLIKKAKKRGIGVILDGVFNHTGADSLYFNRYGKYDSLGAYQSKKSPYYSWYDFQSFPDKYTSWWGIEILPRINPDKKECGDFFTADGGVIDKYAKLGVEGFRLDVVDELSDTFVKRLKNTLDKSNKQSVLYGEVWEDASNKIAYGKRKSYYLGEELDGVMNYPARRAVISFIKDKNISDMEYYFQEVMQNAPKRIRDLQMNLLGTHDTERILTLLGGESSLGKNNDYLSKVRLSKEELKIAVIRLKLAYSVIATIPGIPSIFYGDEAGLEGYQDPFNRRPYPWDSINREILNFYRKIGKIREENSVYKHGDFKLLCLTENVLIFSRFDDKNNIITAVNNGTKQLLIEFSAEACTLLKKRRTKKLILPAFSAEIIRVEKNSSINLSNYL